MFSPCTSMDGSTAPSPTHTNVPAGNGAPVWRDTTSGPATRRTESTRPTTTAGGGSWPPWEENGRARMENGTARASSAPGDR